MPTDLTGPEHLSAVILAGGRGTRMGGADKGLQPFGGVPLVLHALRRLQQQTLPPSALLINANRNLTAYASFGVPVWPDADPTVYAGPLAGFLTGLRHCQTPYLLSVPCDTPLFPLDLAARLAQALRAANADIAIASARVADTDGSARSALRSQPVFCLMRSTVRHSLIEFTRTGGRKIECWSAQQRSVQVPFDRPDDAALAFFNANSPAELLALAQSR